MEQIEIKAFKREKLGSGESGRLRKQGIIPTVVYGHNINLSLAIPRSELLILKKHHFSENLIINLSIEGENEPLSVLVKDVQHDPLTEDVKHLDFFHISLKEKVSVKVPIEIKGEPKGVKEGGVLEHHLWEVEVQCLPTDIPESVIVDISNLDIGDSLHIRDISAVENVEILEDPEEVIVSVAAVKEESEEEAVEEEGAEPQVIKEKPKEAASEDKDKEKGKKG